MAAESSADTELPQDLVRKIDELCARFEAGLREERPPDVDLLVNQVPATARAVLMRELLLLEFEYRKPASVAAWLAEWMQRFPDDLHAILQVAASVVPLGPNGPDGEGSTEHDNHPEGAHEQSHQRSLQPRWQTHRQRQL